MMGNGFFDFITPRVLAIGIPSLLISAVIARGIIKALGASANWILPMVIGLLNAGFYITVVVIGLPFAFERFNCYSQERRTTYFLVVNGGTQLAGAVLGAFIPVPFNEWINAWMRFWIGSGLGFIVVCAMTAWLCGAW